MRKKKKIIVQGTNKDATSTEFSLGWGELESRESMRKGTHWIVLYDLFHVI